GTPEEEREPVRGRGEQRRERLRPTLTADRHRHSIDGGHRADLDRVSDHEERVVADVAEAPEVRKEEHLEQRVTQHGRDVVGRALPAEERAVGQDTADREDPECVLHTSDSAARSRARLSKTWMNTCPIARYAIPSTTHIPSAGSGSPPKAAARTARKPQVGASTQER